MACGGHPLPLLLRADGDVEPVGAPGTLLGLVERLELEDRAAELRAGDTLVLYTDGLTEARRAGRRLEPRGARARASRRCAAATRRPSPTGCSAMAAPDPARALRDDIAIVALRAAG